MPASWPGEEPRLLRGRDARKDQSYVLSCLTSAELRQILLPVGHLEKAAVRALAAELGLPTAAKPDSQDVCFVLQGTGAGGRERFLSDRLELHSATVVDHASQEVLGEVPAVELVTVGQRRGLNVGGGERRFALSGRRRPPSDRGRQRRPICWPTASCWGSEPGCGRLCPRGRR